VLTRNRLEAFVRVFDFVDNSGGLQLIKASFSFTAAQFFDRFSQR
jgi:hypothetical protein